MLHQRPVSPSLLCFCRFRFSFSARETGRGRFACHSVTVCVCVCVCVCRALMGTHERLSCEWAWAETTPGVGTVVRCRRPTGDSMSGMLAEVWWHETGLLTRHSCDVTSAQCFAAVASRVRSGALSQQAHVARAGEFVDAAAAAQAANRFPPLQLRPRAPRLPLPLPPIPSGGCGCSALLLHVGRWAWLLRCPAAVAWRRAAVKSCFKS